MVDGVEQADLHLTEITGPFVKRSQDRPTDRVSFYSRQHLLILTTSSTVLEITVAPSVTVVSRVIEILDNEGFRSPEEMVVQIEFIMQADKTSENLDHKGRESSQG